LDPLAGQWDAVMGGRLSWPLCTPPPSPQQGSINILGGTSCRAFAYDGASPGSRNPGWSRPGAVGRCAAVYGSHHWRFQRSPDVTVESAALLGAAVALHKTVLFLATCYRNMGGTTLSVLARFAPPTCLAPYTAPVWLTLIEPLGHFLPLPCATAIERSACTAR